MLILIVYGIRVICHILWTSYIPFVLYYVMYRAAFKLYSWHTMRVAWDTLVDRMRPTGCHLPIPDLIARGLYIIDTLSLLVSYLQNDMPYFRRRMVFEILSKKLMWTRRSRWSWRCVRRVSVTEDNRRSGGSIISMCKKWRTVTLVVKRLVRSRGGGVIP